MKLADTETLVIITPGFPADEKDSVCLPSQQLFVSALNRSFPHLRIIVLSLEYPFRRSIYTWNGNKVYSYHGWNKGKLQKLRTCWLVWQRLRRINREHKPIGLLSFWCTEAALIGKYFGQWNRVRHFSWILGQDAKKENKYPRWIKPRAESLIALSEFLAREFNKNHGIRPRWVIPNAIDESLFGPEPGNQDIDLIGVGSLIPLKQYDLFITLVSKLKVLYPEIRCLICGKGPEQESLNHLISDLRLTDTVKLAGELPHVEVLALMQRSRILLHPSSYEGYSTVCLEALYAGAEVISFSNPKESWIRHWHIAKDREDMLHLLQELLSENLDHEQVLLYSMKDQARDIMNLFGYNSLAIR